MSNTSEQQLIFGLSHFGLNPGDWKLVPKSKYIFHIENKATPSFYLRGVCNQLKGRLQWTKIILVSL